MKIASMAEIGADFATYLKASEKGPVVVTRQSKPVAVLLATDNKEDLERLLMGHSSKLQAILQAARKRFRSGSGISHEIFWKPVERKNARKRKKRSNMRKGA